VEDIVKLSTVDGDWATLRDLSLWLFHTPEGAVPALPPGIPVVAVSGG
jgi:cellulose synthase (UDP-forming)